MKHFAHAAACIVLLCHAAAAAGRAADIFRVSDRTALPLEQMMQDLRAVDIIYVGELHHMEEHHQFAPRFSSNATATNCGCTS